MRAPGATKLGTKRRLGAAFQGAVPVTLNNTLREVLERREGLQRNSSAQIATG